MKEILTALLLLITISVNAQHGIVRGEVYDDNGLLPGVDITVSGLSSHFLTDADGAFAMKLEPGEYDLSFHFPQYNNEKRTISISVDDIRDVEVEMFYQPNANKEEATIKNQNLYDLPVSMFIFVKKLVMHL